MNWNKLKAEVETLVQTFPQRAAQGRHGIALVEQGLAELAKVGYAYQPVLKQLVETVEDKPEPKTLTVEQAMGHVTGHGQPGNPSMVEHETSAVHQSN